METHVMSMRDDGDGVYHDVVIAPNHTTARRMFAMRMLDEYERNLRDIGETSLDEYAPSRALDQDWMAERSVTCVRCGAGRTRPLEHREMAFMGISPIIHGGMAHVCLSCAGTWISTGTYAPLREDLEARAERELAELDAFEARSLLGEEEESEDETE